MVITLTPTFLCQKCGFGNRNHKHMYAWAKDEQVIACHQLVQIKFSIIFKRMCLFSQSHETSKRANEIDNPSIEVNLIGMCAHLILQRCGLLLSIRKICWWSVEDWVNFLSISSRHYILYIYDGLFGQTINNLSLHYFFDTKLVIGCSPSSSWRSGVVKFHKRSLKYFFYD